MLEGLIYNSAMHSLQILHLAEKTQYVSRDLSKMSYWRATIFSNGGVYKTCMVHPEEFWYKKVVDTNIWQITEVF